MSNKDYMKLLQDYILKHKGRRYDPRQQDWCDHDHLLMFGDEIMDEYPDEVILIVNEFANGNIKYALYLFESFMRPENISVTEYYNKHLEDFI